MGRRITTEVPPRRRILNLYCSAMLLNGVVSQGQTQSATVAHLAGGVERFEYTVVMRLGNSRPVIGNVRPRRHRRSGRCEGVSPRRRARPAAAFRITFMKAWLSWDSFPMTSGRASARRQAAVTRPVMSGLSNWRVASRQRLRSRAVLVSTPGWAKDFEVGDDSADALAPSRDSRSNSGDRQAGNRGRSGRPPPLVRRPAGRHRSRP